MPARVLIFLFVFGLASALFLGDGRIGAQPREGQAPFELLFDSSTEAQETSIHERVRAKDAEPTPVGNVPEHRIRSQDTDAAMLLRTDASMALLQEGRLAIIEFRLHSAERSFTRLANSPDGRPAGLYHLAMVSFFRFLMSDAEQDRIEFEERSDELKKELDRHSDSPWRALLGAETNLQRAMVRAKTGKYVRAALAARNAYQEFDRIVKTYPTFYDAHKGYGLLKLGIGSMPTTYRRFLAMIGFSGGVEEGLRSLRIAAQQGAFSREEAIAYMSLAHVVMLEPSDGLAGMRELQESYPQSTLFAHLYGYVLFENRRVEEAEKLFRFVVDANDEHFAIDYSDYFLGLSLFRLNRFDGAERHFRRYVERHNGQALNAPAQLYLGLSIELQGRRQEALSFYRSVTSDREFDLDAVSKRRATRALDFPIDAVTRELILAANYYDSGFDDKAVELLEPISVNTALSVESRAEAMYRLGRVYHGAARYEMALASYGRAIELRGDVLSRWAPWSEYYSGRVYEYQHRFAEAQAAYERALQYTGQFDYYQALENNAKLGLRRVR